jgi:hypothetical protein
MRLLKFIAAYFIVLLLGIAIAALRIILLPVTAFYNLSDLYFYDK